MDNKDNSAPKRIWIRCVALPRLCAYGSDASSQRVFPDDIEYVRADLTRSRPSVPDDAVCVEGVPMMHGPHPYKWCATHNDLMMRCEKLRDDAVERAREMVSELANLPLLVPGSQNVVFKTIRRLQEQAASIAAALSARPEQPEESPMRRCPDCGNLFRFPSPNERHRTKCAWCVPFPARPEQPEGNDKLADGIGVHIETAILALENQARWWMESRGEEIPKPLARARAGEALSVIESILNPLLSRVAAPPLCLMADCEEEQLHFCLKHAVEVFLGPVRKESFFAVAGAGGDAINQP